MTVLSRRGFLKSAAACGVAPVGFTSATEGSPDDDRPNILLIIDDQHSPRAMGWAGECEVITPNLNKLADESVCFTNGYCSSPVCAPTRHTINTGL